MYYTDRLQPPHVEHGPGGLRIVVPCLHEATVVQCYLDGALAGWQRPVGGRAEFSLPDLTRATVALLAVDPADASVNYYAEISETLEIPVDRIRVSLPATMAYGPRAVWTIILDGREVHRQRVHPPGAPGGGLGGDFGRAFGFEPSGMPGFGTALGRGEFGFDAVELEWTSLPLPVGDHQVQSEVRQPDGQIHPVASRTVSVQAWPGPAAGLSADDYDETLDELTLSWNPSEDLP